MDIFDDLRPLVYTPAQELEVLDAGYVSGDLIAQGITYEAWKKHQAILNKFHYICAIDTKPNLEANELVRGLLQENKLSVIYGRSNCGKTFFATDLCFHIALGWEWRGRRVGRGAVVYAALEGASGLSNRIAAFGKRYNQIPDNFAVVPCAINLLDPTEDVPAFIHLVGNVARDLGDVKIIVIDTLARATAGGDENSGQDMGLLVKHCTELQQTTGAHVCLIHHSGKDQAKGMRGHSSLQAAIDTEIEVTRDPEELYSLVEAVKQRDLPMDFKIAFVLESMILGENRYGEPVTSCVVGPWDAPKAVKREAKLSDVQRFVLDAITALCEIRGRVPYDMLRDELEARGFKDMYTKKGEPKEVKTLTSNARIALQKRGLIDFDGTEVWVV